MWRGITVAWHGITVAWAFLLGTTTVRRWVLGAFMLGSGLFILLLIGVLLIARQAKKQTQDSPEWRSYTSDNFYGLKWVWPVRRSPAKSGFTAKVASVLFP